VRPEATDRSAPAFSRAVALVDVPAFVESVILSSAKDPQYGPSLPRGPKLFSRRSIIPAFAVAGYTRTAPGSLVARCPGRNEASPAPCGKLAHGHLWLGWVVICLAEIRLQEGESIESALRRFKRKVQTEDIIKEVKRHSYYLKPGAKLRVKQALARKRAQKKIRKEPKD
jgi:small subunit ribosomal protein S21